MSKEMNYIIFALIAIVLAVSFFITYNGGDDIVINQSEFVNDNIMVNVYQQDEGLNLQMASINPNYKIEVSYNSNKSSTFNPGFSTFTLEDQDFKLKTYRKWLQIIWLPYQSVDVDINQEDLEELPEQATLNFKAEFADNLMKYYVENQ
jgi:hypothetical protein